jgi:hypothetical protein
MPTIAAVCAAASAHARGPAERWRPGVEEPVCLYWLVFSPTGSMKSQVLAKATQAIRALELERRESVEAENRHRASQRKWREQQLQRLRRKVAPKVHVEKQAWLQEMAELEAQVEQHDPALAPQWLQGDVNPSLLPKILRHNYEAEGIARCSVLVDEGTFLSNVTGRHQGSTMVETLLSAVNGAPLDFVRASQTSDDMVSIRLPATFMTICAFVQPDYYDRLTTNQHLADCGFLGRTIRTVLDAPAKRVPYESPPIPDAIQSAYDAWLRALATQEVPEVIDLTADATTGALVRSLYETIEVDGTGFSRRAMGLVARVAAIIQVGSGIDASPRSNSSPRLPGAVKRSYVHDYIDEFGDAEDEYPIGDSGTRGTGVRDGTGGALPLTRIINDLFLYIYVRALRGVRAVERPVAPLATLLTHVRRHLPWVSPIKKTNRRRVTDLAKTWNARSRPSPDRIYQALEELEQEGVIEWVPASLRKYGGQQRYREFIVVPQDPEPGSDG